MNVSPVNNTNFKSNIIKNEFFEEAIKASKNHIQRGEYKSLNCAKSLYDSLTIIRSDKSAKDVSFIIDDKVEKAFALADGKKAAEYTYNPNTCIGYAVQQVIKIYAETLNKIPVPSLLDELKSNYEAAVQNLAKANENYRINLKTEFENLINNL